MNEIPGLVISSIDYKEKSKIVYLYTPYGHDSIRANHSKDMKKGLLGFTTTLNQVNYIKTNAKFPTLIEYNLVKTNFDLASSIKNITAITAILKVIQNIPDDANHERLFNYIIEIINSLYTNDSKKVLSIFLIKMLYVFGVNPMLKECISCKSSEVYAFSILNAGALCKKCSNTLNTNLLDKWIEYYYDKKDISSYSDTNFDILLEDIKKYYINHANIDLKI